MNNFKFPKELKEYIAKAHALKAKKEARVKKYTDIEKERLAKIDAERQKRVDELMSHANEIVSWTRAFLDTPEARELAEILGHGKKLSLFVGKFWRGEPIPATVRTERARLCFELWTERNLFNLRYEELHKGQVSEEIKIYSASGLVRQLHPEFLRQAGESLRTGKVWEYMFISLPPQ